MHVSKSYLRHGAPIEMKIDEFQGALVEKEGVAARICQYLGLSFKVWYVPPESGAEQFDKNRA
jgi:hypothetical protein